MCFKNRQHAAIAQTICHGAGEEHDLFQVSLHSSGCAGSNAFQAARYPQAERNSRLCRRRANLQPSAVHADTLPALVHRANKLLGPARAASFAPVRSAPCAARRPPSLVDQDWQITPKTLANKSVVSARSLRGCVDICGANRIAPRLRFRQEPFFCPFRRSPAQPKIARTGGCSSDHSPELQSISGQCARNRTGAPSRSSVEALRRSR